MPLIIIIIVAIYLIMISWTWQNMESIDKKKKIGFIAIGLVVMLIVTYIVFNISKINITYNNEESKVAVRRLLVSLFTGVNSIIVLPYLGKILNKVHENEIKEEIFKRKVIIIAIIFIVCIIFECNYLKSIQQGIIQIYNNTSIQKGL